MNKEETLALFAQGREAWNAWAEEMLARRAELEAAGTWETQEFAINHPEPQNEATAGWFNAARADFVEHSFNDKADFKGLLFPHDADFDNTSFEQDVRFDKATFSGNADFEGATFCESAGFDKATFSGDATFNKATFRESARFGGARFTGIVWFENATLNKGPWFADATFDRWARFNCTRFEGDTWFDHATFSGYAEFMGAKFGEVTWFTGATFSRRARFENATFSGYVRFDRATFSGYAGFQHTIFKGYASFASVHFDDAASFPAANANGGFLLDGARFCEVPDLTQAHFAEAPCLDDIVIPEVPCAGELFGSLIIRKRRVTGTAAEYRALKRVAIQAHDHKLELDFFASELKASGGVTRWTVGLLYELFSNFGRCWLLPLIWLAVTWVVSAWGYVAIHFAAAEAAGRSYGIHSLRWAVRWITSGLTGAAPGLSCINASSTDPLSAAALLSLAKSLPYGAVLPDAKSVDVFKCLFGSSIPGGVVVVGIVQLLLSLVLLFLFLLAVRNHFRIR